MIEERVPFEALAEILGTVCHDYSRAVAPTWRAPLEGEVHRELGDTMAVAARLGISRRTAQRWKTDGVPLFTADRLLTAIGVHPAEVWPLEYRMSEPT